MDDAGRQTGPFQSFLSGLVDALNKASAKANAAAPASRRVVALGGLKSGGPLVGDVGVALYVAVDVLSALPTTGNAPGDWAFGVNVRKPGEAAGAGTGMPVFWSNTAWFTSAGALATT